MSSFAPFLHPQKGYENPEKFDPERFGAERGEDVKFATNYLVFGHGPHYCVGKEYAQNHLATFLARISTSLDWTRIRSKVRRMFDVKPPRSSSDVHDSMRVYKNCTAFTL